MQDLISVITNDHIDENKLNSAYDFHCRGHNRNILNFTPYPPKITKLSNDSIHMMEFKENNFGGKVIDCHPKKIHKQKRKPSCREFYEKNAPLSNKIFKSLLFNSFGQDLKKNGRRPYPSAGAFYATEIIIFVQNVEGIEVGSYHYLPISHKLEKLNYTTKEKVTDSLLLNKNKLKNFDFFILYASLASRYIAKYGMRGYRLACLEVGSMYQNFISCSEKLGLTGCLWGGFIDEELSVNLGTDPRVLWPMVCQVLGRQ